MRSWSTRLAVVGLLVGLVSGCTEASSPVEVEGQVSVEPSARSVPTFRHYVAMGDSYTAAPGVPRTGPPPCHRSDGNYPSLVAAELDVTYVDVSCVGASTASVTGEQRLGGEVLPPQLSAVTPRTDLVTLGIGGNDLDLFGDLVAGCGRLALERLNATQEQLAELSEAPCQDLLGGRLEAKVDEIGGRVLSTLRAIRGQAPRATVVLVGYPQLVPETGACQELPLVPGDYPFVRSVTVGLEEALARAARRAGAEYASLHEASLGHDICAGEDAWVNGFTADNGRGWQFHPFAEGQEAAAEQVVSVLER